MSLFKNRDATQKKFNNFGVKAAPYVFISPFFIAFLVFLAFPIAYSLFLSVHSWDGIGDMQFNGLKNFVYVFNDAIFWKTLANTLIMLLLGAIPMNMLALFFAFLLNQTFIKMKNTFKTILFLPYITSAVAIALIFGIFYEKEFGILNFLIKQGVEVLNFFGAKLQAPKIEWLKGPLTLFSVSMLSIWRWTGWNTMLYLAGMQGINKGLYEAAEIDGASKTQTFFRITLPMLKPIIFFAVTMSIIGGMQAFDEPRMLLGADGGPANLYMGVSSSMYIYDNAFRFNYFGVAAAASYVLFLVILVMTWVTKRIFRDKD